QLGKVGDAVHRAVQRAEKADAVVAHAGVLVHHHNLVEKRVHRRLQRRESLQGSSVIECAEGFVNIRAQPAERLREALFLRQNHELRIEVRGHHLGLLQYVSDALVRGNKAFCLGQRGEGADSLELPRNEIKSRRVEAKNGFNFIRGVAAFLEVTACAFEYERLQVGVRIPDPCLSLKAFKSIIDEVRKRHFQLALDQNASNPQGSTAQAERIAISRRRLPYSEKARQSIELVGERNGAGHG